MHNISYRDNTEIDNIGIVLKLHLFKHNSKEFLILVPFQVPESNFLKLSFFTYFYKNFAKD